MLKFKRLEGPCDIPVFYQHLPDTVRGTAIGLTVFTGSADDTLVGEPGIYHWFEHVPFRGTVKFPGGYLATKGPVTRVGGRVGAWTSRFCTNYWATVPTRHLGVGMDIVVDLVAQPLLTDEVIVAEREIIGQEIRESLGSANGSIGYKLGSILWGSHPIANPVLGSMESLRSMTPDSLRIARRMGYDRSRMAFFISTALSEKEVLAMLRGRFDVLPSNGLNERRTGASYGLLRWAQGKRTEFQTEFSSSVVKVLFELPPMPTKRDLAKQALLVRVFGYGGSGSPLYRAVREDRQLSYSASASSYHTKDGGYWGFHVNTSLTRTEAVEEALEGMLEDPQLRSQKWFDDINEAAKGYTDMMVIDPHELVDQAVDTTVLIGEPLAEEEMIEIAGSIPHGEILAAIDSIRFENARRIIASGR